MVVLGSLLPIFGTVRLEDAEVQACWCMHTPTLGRRAEEVDLIDVHSTVGALHGTHRSKFTEQTSASSLLLLGLSGLPAQNLLVVMFRYIFLVVFKQEIHVIVDLRRSPLAQSLAVVRCFVRIG